MMFRSPSDYFQQVAGAAGSDNDYWNTLFKQLGPGVLDRYGAAATEGMIRGGMPYQYGASNTEAAIRGLPGRLGTGAAATGGSGGGMFAQTLGTD